MKRVFVDSGGFFANLVPENASHHRATSLFRDAQDGAWQLDAPLPDEFWLGRE